MYCSKCKYISYDHMDTCPKCGLDWTEERKKLGIEWLEPALDGWLESGLEKSAGKVVDPDNLSFHSLQESDHPDQELLSLKEQGKAAGDDFSSSPGLDLSCDIDPGFESEPDFQLQEKPAARKKPLHSGQDYEIDYPDLEIIDSDEKKSQNS